MGYEDRPAADPIGLREHLRAWQAGEELPGRTLANLKTGRLDEVIAALGDDAGLSAEARSAWDDWEAGRAEPGAVLVALVEGGLPGALESLSRA